MGWTLNTNNAECDGCGYKEINVDLKNAAYWYDDKRVNDSGSIEEFLYCGACHDKYQSFLQKQSVEFRVFARGLKGVKK